MTKRSAAPYPFTIGSPERVNEIAPDALKLLERMEQLNELHRVKRSDGEEGLFHKRPPVRELLYDGEPLILPLTFDNVADTTESIEPIQEALLDLPAVIVGAELSSSERAATTLYVILKEHELEPVKRELHNLQP
jgi:hypothetical protein